MKITTGMILGLICMNILAFSTYPLTVDEVRKHNNKHKSTQFKTNHVYRSYRKDSEMEFRRRHMYRNDIKSEFCESLVNTVVRIKTAHLRMNAKGRSTELSWSQRKGSLYLEYKCKIKNGWIIREECLLNLRGMPEIKTVNGRISGNVSAHSGKLQKLLKKLKKYDFDIAEVRMLIPDGTTREAAYFINSIIPDRPAIISEAGERQPAVMIKFKDQ